MVTKEIIDYTEDLSTKNFVCPFCGSSVPKVHDTFKVKECFFNSDIQLFRPEDTPVYKNVFEIQMLYCPACKDVSFYAVGKKFLKDLKLSLYPKSLAKKMPKYIPLAIRSDYEEAYSILDLSPKASATLSRRCLQGMIRDFWGITKGNLYEEINELKGKIPKTQWDAINAVRSIGNIGAHMEKDINIIIDVDPGEAEKLINLIELLIEKWYIARHDEEQLYLSVIDISNEKKTKKH